jgi:hypothetical protein
LLIVYRLLNLCYRDGRLRERDQILAIDGQPLDISHQEAIRILQSARGLVVLIIARGYVPPQFDPPQLVNAEPAPSLVPNVQSEVHSDMVVGRLPFTLIKDRKLGTVLVYRSPKLMHLNNIMQGLG